MDWWGYMLFDKAIHRVFIVSVAGCFTLLSPGDFWRIIWLLQDSAMTQMFMFIITLAVFSIAADAGCQDLNSKPKKKSLRICKSILRLATRCQITQSKK